MRALKNAMLGGIAAVLIFIPAIVNAQSTWTGSWENPKVFIENKGQFHLPSEKKDGPSEVLYAFDDGANMIYFTNSGVTYTFMSRVKQKVVLDKSQFSSFEEYKEEKAKNKAEVKVDVIHMQWENANGNVKVTASEQTPDHHAYNAKINGEDVNYSELKAFKRITYLNLYPNIDVEFVFHPEKGIKYNLTLHPGADPSLIKMKYAGHDGLSLDPAGNLHIKTMFGDIVDHAPFSYYKKFNVEIASSFNLSSNTVGFNLGALPESQAVIIDPWTVTPAFPNSGKIWECERDAAANAYIYGGDTPMRLRKYNSAGTLQWTYNSSWDTSGFWVGSFVVDLAGNSYITSGSNGEIRKVNTAGASVWYNNPNGPFGPLFEYWHLTFNCDETKLIVGGMRAQSPFSVNSFRGAIMNINLATGAIIGTPLTVGWMAGLTIKEVRSICWSPNGNYYFLTLDSVGCMNAALGLQWKYPSTYNFGYGIPSYGVTNQGISAIRATGSFIYTHNGSTLHKRDINTGVIVATAAIPNGVTITQFGSSSPGNSGLDIDACGNVYVGSINQVHKYDANLNLLSTVAASSAVYDVAVTAGGEVLACGNGFFSSLNMTSCAPVAVTCVASPLSTTMAQTNPLCNGQCTGTATVTASGGTSPYTYLWSNSQVTATATGLCAGTYTVTVTDAASATVTSTVTITQPAALTSSVQSQTNLLCNAVCSGSATITSSGGTGVHTYSWAPSGGNAATATGLCAGTYTVTITDANNCTRTQTVTITQPTALSASATSTNASCANNDGTATATSSGGTGTHTYSWAPSGGTNANATGLGAGTYTVTVTDANGCTMTATAVVGSSGGPTVTLSSQTNVLCNGGNTGSATVSVSGGNSPYSYSWSPSGGTNATATGLFAGTYTVTVTDQSPCTQVFTVTITQPTAIVVNPASTSTNCGASTGTATASPSGGTPGYSYLWQPGGATTSNISGLSAGTYTVIITDANNCTMSSTVTVTNLNGPNVTLASQTNVLCFGSSTGSATVSVTGGTSPYTYNWTPSGGTNASATGLGAGTYTVIVTDANNCTNMITVVITEPAALSLSLNGVNASCGNNNGAVSSTVSGGTSAYTYSWQPGGATSSAISNLGAGTYTCTVTDANGCTITSTATITSSSGLSVTASNDTTISIGQSAQLSAGGGTGYSWSPSSGLSCTACPNPVASPTATTTYTVIVTDASGCTGTATITVNVVVQCGDNGVFFIPDVFSPNFDMINDLLFVRGGDITELYFAVYDRWGEKVFETTDQAVGWDGTYKGRELDPAVFVYYLKAKCFSGEEIIQKGNVTILK